MSHPMQEHRQHKVERSRVGHIAHGYASGGGVHSDQAADAKLIKRMVKKPALKMHGHEAKPRADRVKRASGGRVKHGKHGKGTNVNVIIAPQGGHGASPMQAGGPPMMPPGAPPPAAMPPRPPMMPPPGAPPMGGAPGMPPGMPPHARGGRAYAKGGAVKNTKAWDGMMKAITPVQHNDSGKTANQKPQPGQLNRGKPITYATGGPVEHPVKGGMAPKLDGGAGGGTARMEKPKRIVRK